MSTPDAGQLKAANIGAELRKIRSLLGLGLRLCGVAALEAPWFLDRDHTDKYQAAVFANNALLANALTDRKSKEEVSGLGAIASKWFNPTIRLRRFCALQ